MRLEDIEWGYSTKQLNEPLWDLSVWGAKPMKILADMLADEIEDFYDSEHPEKSDVAFFAVHELQKYTEDLLKTLDRLNCEALKESREGTE